MAVREWAPTGGAAPDKFTHPNGVAREQVSGIQRARLLAAMVQVASERGLAEATVARVVARAGVSRRTFYELFEDREQCFLAALEEAIGRVADSVVPAYERGEGWRERIRGALGALLLFLDAEADRGRILIVGSLEAGPDVLDRRRRVLACAIAAIEEGSDLAKGGSTQPSMTAEGVVGGALSIVHARMVDGDRPLIRLLNPLMSMIVLPYLGPAAARKELERPLPESVGIDSDGAGDPLRDLGMRLTYRTVRVLVSVAASPGLSNRELGESAGISDQGQISKLLARLQGLGLVENSGLAPGKGAPNAWTLTAKGRQVEHAMGGHNGD